MGVLFTVLWALTPPARSDERTPLRPDQPPFFSADAAITLDSLGRPALSVAISVPYTELQWVKHDNGYAAGAEFTVSFEPNDKKRLYGDLWERRVAVPSFSATRSPNTSLTDHRTIKVPPGKYTVRVRVRDASSEMTSSASQKLEVPDFAKVPVGFADLELGVVDTTGGFTPIPERRFGHNVDRIGARVTLFDRRAGSWPRTYPLHYRVRTSDGEDLSGGIQEIRLERSGQPVIVGPAKKKLFIGTYMLLVELTEGKAHWQVDRSFEVEESGPPQGREFERMLEPLGYIASSDEIAHLRSLSPAEQAQGWEEFWKRRDPTPETVRNEAMIEFVRRVAYADKHFQGFGPGWRSDMGRIYIKFGAPDQIENHAATSEAPPLEIWYYNTPYRRLVFADREGFGRYTLVSPQSE